MVAKGENNPSAVEAAESVYMRERVKYFLTLTHIQALSGASTADNF